MDTRMLEETLRWMRTTDLIEILFRDGEEGFELGAPSAAEPPAPPLAASSLVPVPSPGVGAFKSSKPGGPRAVEEGGPVARGQSLGFLETGGAPVEIEAPTAGRLRKALIQDGGPAEFGQVLFLIAP